MNNRLKVNSILEIVHNFEEKLMQGRLERTTEVELNAIIGYYDDGDLHEKIIEVCELGAMLFPKALYFNLRKAEVLNILGKWKEAISFLAEIESIVDDDFAVQCLRAKIFTDNGDFQRAMFILEDLSSFHSDERLVEVYMIEANIYEKLFDYDAMFESLKRAILLNPKDQQILARLLTSIEHSRKYEQSIQLHKLIIDNHPYNYYAWYNLGHAYASIGEYHNAIDAVEYSFIIESEFEAGYHDCAEFCLEIKNYKRALSIYEEVLEIFGPDSDILCKVGMCHIELNQPNEARSALFRAIQFDSFNEEVFFLLAKCYIINEEWNDAIKALRKAIKLDNQNDEYYFNIAMCFDHIGNIENANKNYKIACTKGQEQAEYWERYILFLKNNFDTKSALKALERAIEVTFSEKILFYHASLLFELGNTKEALELFNEALDEHFEFYPEIFHCCPLLKENIDIKNMIQFYGIRD